MRHSNILENVYHTNFWFPLEEGAGICMPRRFSHRGFSVHVCRASFRRLPGYDTKFNPQSFCETVQRERVTHTVLVPTMINMLTQISDAAKV